MQNHLPRARAVAIIFRSVGIEKRIPSGKASNSSPLSTRVANLIIAIDGPAASGKSTTAKRVADRLGYTYIDSGAMYRAAALRALRLGVSLDDPEALTEAARNAKIELLDRGRGPILLDGEDVSAAIRDEEVTVAASRMSAVSGVRRALVRQQRAMGFRTDCVMEGRDIGTVVFPDADLKVYLVASLEERARRRYRQDVEQGLRPPLEGDDLALALREIADEIRERDRRDSTRLDSPLRKAEDAVEIDTTELTIDEQVERVVELAIERGAAPQGGGARQP